MNKFLIPLTAATLVLAGCGGKDKDDNDGNEPDQDMRSYTVTVTNLTHNQPLSPIALMVHGASSLWQTGSAATVAFEEMAESGDNTALLAEIDSEYQTSTEAPVGPGAMAEFEFELEYSDSQYLAIATMLVNTNDAFTGLNGFDLGNLEVNQSMSHLGSVYDAGTEANSETAASIPGPVAGGEGYNSERDDIDMISLHPGVVTQDDGLSSSVLTFAERFDNPAIKITIARTQ